MLDIEAAGCHKRDAAIAAAEQELHLSYSTIEKAVLKYEDQLKIIKAGHPELLNNLRTAFK